MIFKFAVVILYIMVKCLDNKPNTLFINGYFIKMLQTLRLFFSAVLFVVLTSTAQAAAQQEKFVAAVPYSFPPYYQIDDDGRPEGFSIDVMDAVAKRAGIQIEYLPMEEWDDVVNSIGLGVSDLIPNIGMSESRSQIMDFSKSVETFNISFFVRNESRSIFTDERRLQGYKVATVKGNMASGIVAGLPQYHGIVYETFEDALFALISGQVEALVYPEPVAWKLIYQSRQQNAVRVVGSPLVEVKRVIGVSKGNTALMSKIDTAVEAFIVSDEYREIHRKKGKG